MSGVPYLGGVSELRKRSPWLPGLRWSERCPWRERKKWSPRSPRDPRSSRDSWSFFLFVSLGSGPEPRSELSLILPSSEPLTKSRPPPELLLSGISCSVPSRLPSLSPISRLTSVIGLVPTLDFDIDPEESGQFRGGPY